MNRIEGTAFFTGLILSVPWLISKLGWLVGGIIVMIMVGTVMNFFAPQDGTRGPVQFDDFTASVRGDGMDRGVITATNNSAHYVNQVTIECGADAAWFSDMGPGESQSRDIRTHLSTDISDPSNCVATDVRSE